MDNQFAERLNLAFEMWERTHGHPLDDDTVAQWLTTAGHPASADLVRDLRTGKRSNPPVSVRAGLAKVFSVDPRYFTVSVAAFDPADADVLADMENSSLRRLGQVLSGVSVRTLLYLESVADTLRSADGLPPWEHTAQV